MVVKSIIDDMLPNIWPLVLFISVVAITLRCAYLFRGSKKFVLHKELLSLVFIIYILCLYYVLTYQDINYGGVNLIPFKEMTRYEIGSYKFMKNIVGNILLFVPFGYFVSYYCKLPSVKYNLLITIITSTSIETIQSAIGRSFDIDDIILNVIGGVCGYVIFLITKKLLRKYPDALKNNLLLNLLVVITIMVLVVIILNLYGVRL